MFNRIFMFKTVYLSEPVQIIKNSIEHERFVRQNKTIVLLTIKKGF